MQKWTKIINFPASQLLKDQLENFFTRYNWLSLGSTKEIFSPKSKIDIRHIIPQDIPNILELFDRTFAECEPLVKTLQLPDNSKGTELKEFFKKSIEHGTTFIASLNNMKNLFGAVINTKITPWEPEWFQLTTHIKCPKTKDLINLWGFVVKDSKMLKTYRNGNIFNINHVIVDESLSEKYNINKLDLSTMLVDKSLKMAPLVGCKLASVICIGNNTMHQVAENLNMKLIYDNPCSKLIYLPMATNSEANINVKIFTKAI